MMRQSSKRIAPTLAVLALCVTSGAGDVLSADPVPREGRGMLTLEQAQALALERNHRLNARSHAVRAAEARILQARAIPNPELEVEVEEYDRGGEAFDSAETAIVLGQRVELGGKRRWRIRVSEAEVELAGWDYERKRRDVLAETVQRFVGVLTAQRRLDLAESTVDLAEMISHAVAERVKAGKEPPLQLSKAAAELELARMELLESRSDLDVARKMLGALWGTEAPMFRGVEGDLDAVPESVPAIEAFRSRLAANPDVARWGAELQHRRDILSSERAARVPDIEASIGFLRFEEDDTDALAFRIGMPLPLFDRNSGSIAAAKHEISRAEAERRAAETAAATALASAHAQLVSAHRRVVTLRMKVVPAMEAALDAARKGYEQGKFGFLDMLDAQRGLFDAEADLVTGLSAYHSTAADMERLTGTTIKEAATSRRREQR